ncbi:FAD-dependent thymidylate synthase [Fimbriimonas ginsengisoli]|uniref:Flavin-dependent thymidylate synthase n=1 Tax=Fimbriimonas ginsengisoli Gsoil 348 TaxID=661478 RepID=A0A068NIX6_FIMGI|nr:FAD-dependent thymidylate synthase [Fimbriimonas ginsengisoli]AIE83471.1 thymidylate synthase thyX [Fimbriimonas ginsengisoli Gsoil 348]
MARLIVPAAEEILDKPFPVLDKGFVRLVDYMGSDERIVQAARVSYGEGTKTFRQDRGLIHYLIRNWHTSPIEQVQLTFHCKMPIFVARQWVRHRTARLNEISGRYSVMKDEFYVPSPEHIRPQSSDNKQGRSEDRYTDEEEREIIALFEDEQRQVYANYQKLLDKNLARELARNNLPLSLYTEWYWQIDLHNLFHFLRLRLDPHAQYEIRAYAEAMAECARAVAPLAYEGFEEYILGSVSFSKAECEALADLLGGREVKLQKRQLQIFEEKLTKVRRSEPAPPPEEPELERLETEGWHTPETSTL